MVSADLVPSSFGLLSKASPVRRAAIRIVTHKLFDHFMLLIIMLNCTSLALESNKPNFDQTQLAHVLKICEYVFLGIFTVEVLLKWTAYGVGPEGPYTYFRDGESD